MGFGAAQVLSGATKLSELGIDVEKFWEGYRIWGVAAPLDPSGVATKAYVDALVGNVIMADGSYVGSDLEYSAIAHGLGSKPKITLIWEALGSYWFAIYDNAVTILFYISAAGMDRVVMKTPDADAFYVGKDSLFAKTANESGHTYHWIAFAVP